MDKSEFYVSLAKTLDGLQREVEETLKAHGLSEPQYNVLCVLQAAHPEALSCGDIAAGMISRDPDITRLLDRLERCGYIERRRGSPDRRLVSVNILAPGLDVLDRVRGPLDGALERRFSALDAAEMSSLAEGLAKIRGRGESAPRGDSVLRREALRGETVQPSGRGMREPAMAFAGAR